MFPNRKADYKADRRIRRDDILSKTNVQKNAGVKGAHRLTFSVVRRLVPVANNTSSEPFHPIFTAAAEAATEGKVDWRQRREGSERATTSCQAIVGSGQSEKPNSQREVRRRGPPILSPFRRLALESYRCFARVMALLYCCIVWYDTAVQGRQREGRKIRRAVV